MLPIRTRSSPRTLLFGLVVAVYVSKCLLVLRVYLISSVGGAYVCKYISCHMSTPITLYLNNSLSHSPATLQVVVCNHILFLPIFEWLLEGEIYIVSNASRSFSCAHWCVAYNDSTFFNLLYSFNVTLYDCVIQGEHYSYCYLTLSVLRLCPWVFPFVYL